MPTYEYECKKCSHRFEAFQAMSDEPLKKCPKCGKELRRLIFGGAGVIFKGPGFYVTDNSNRKSSEKTGKKQTDTVSGINESGIQDKKPAAETGISPAEKKAAKPAAEAVKP
ncbi:MAG: zinc ribbon domain-containing protein [Treponema sp.]|nr:zinc ribbon domain-containing protein [Treponema sp.]MCL2139387.1 zinc ribbon domain-containing protein [Treponema sp.]